MLAFLALLAWLTMAKISKIRDSPSPIIVNLLEVGKGNRACVPFLLQTLTGSMKLEESLVAGTWLRPGALGEAGGTSFLSVEAMMVEAVTPFRAEGSMEELAAGVEVQIELCLHERQLSKLPPS